MKQQAGRCQRGHLRLGDWQRIGRDKSPISNKTRPGQKAVLIRMRDTYVIGILAEPPSEGPIRCNPPREYDTRGSAQAALSTSTPLIGGADLHPETLPDIGPCRIPRQKCDGNNGSKCARR